MNRRIGGWLPVLVWMVVIFLASSDRLSFEHSSALVRPLVLWFYPGATEQVIHGAVGFARKCAHVLEYAVLALLVRHARQTVLRTNPRIWSWRHEAGTVLLVMLYAATDEFHQHFVPSREASVWDVLLDTSGATLALFLVWAFGRWRKSWKRAEDL